MRKKKMYWVSVGGEGSCQQAEEHLTEHSVCRHAPVSRPRNTWQNTLSVDMCLSADRGTPDRTLCLSTCSCQQTEEHLTEHSVCQHAPVSRPRNTWQNTLFVDVHLLKVDPWDIHNRKKWRATGRCKGNTAVSRTPPLVVVSVVYLSQCKITSRMNKRITSARNSTIKQLKGRWLACALDQFEAAARCTRDDTVVKIPSTQHTCIVSIQTGVHAEEAPMIIDRLKHVIPEITKTGTVKS